MSISQGPWICRFAVGSTPIIAACFEVPCLRPVECAVHVATRHLYSLGPSFIRVPCSSLRKIFLDSEPKACLSKTRAAINSYKRGAAQFEVSHAVVPQVLFFPTIG